ncbi:MAG TPA: hypothetical protein VJ044_06290 [Candidatus Hodarchaeales archaeon]|nr:hypothetical protein [Candidatus Hodarchaeales archaeon]
MNDGVIISFDECGDLVLNEKFMIDALNHASRNGSQVRLDRESCRFYFLTWQAATMLFESDLLATDGEYRIKR